TGLGTYYADKYHGRPTASGELYDKFKFTAAHRTLPFGTMVKVTRLDNGRSVVVKVNDRGPFSQGRIIDVSRVAAEQLDMIRTGETQVRIEVVSGSAAGSTSASEGTTFPTTSNPSRPSTTFNPDNRDLSSLPLRDFSGAPAGSATPTTSATTGSASQAPAQHPVMVDAEKYTPAFFQFVAFKREASGFGVQVGAYFSFYRLMEAMDQLAAKGIQNTMLHSSIKDGQPVFRILIGPFPTRDEAKDMQKKVKGQGVEGIVVNFADLR
ncbi:MAG: septal ring lytic transglycosylase RlpA family protein, partial [Bacteroidia bacterium]|nr:septal ring lytic transglycosylase RlpA family protein [Bacteroidia bacterium]